MFRLWQFDLVTMLVLFGISSALGDYGPQFCNSRQNYCAIERNAALSQNDRRNKHPLAYQAELNLHFRDLRKWRSDRMIQTEGMYNRFSRDASKIRVEETRRTQIRNTGRDIERFGRNQFEKGSLDEKISYTSSIRTDKLRIVREDRMPQRRISGKVHSSFVIRNSYGRIDVEENTRARREEFQRNGIIRSARQEDKDNRIRKNNREERRVSGNDPVLSRVNAARLNYVHSDDDRRSYVHDIINERKVRELLDERERNSYSRKSLVRRNASNTRDSRGRNLREELLGGIKTERRVIRHDLNEIPINKVRLMRTDNLQNHNRVSIFEKNTVRREVVAINSRQLRQRESNRYLFGRREVFDREMLPRAIRERGNSHTLFKEGIRGIRNALRKQNAHGRREDLLEILNVRISKNQLSRDRSTEQRERSRETLMSHKISTLNPYEDQARISRQFNAERLIFKNRNENLPTQRFSREVRSRNRHSNDNDLNTRDISERFFQVLRTERSLKQKQSIRNDFKKQGKVIQVEERTLTANRQEKDIPYEETSMYESLNLTVKDGSKSKLELFGMQLIQITLITIVMMKAINEYSSDKKF